MSFPDLTLSSIQSLLSRSLRAKVREAMTKDAAMNVLGLKLTTEGEIINILERQGERFGKY